MKQGLKLIESALKPRPVAAPVLLVTLDPWHKVFLHNLRDLLKLRRENQLSLYSPVAPFWADVFVISRLPWGRFAQSILLHTALIAILWTSTRLWPERPHVISQPLFHKPEVVYYEASEYLPPLNTGDRKAPLPQKGDPEHSAQPILSVPPEPDNHKQTIVAPPKLKLDRDVPLPNVVAWEHPQPAIPVSATAALRSDLKIPMLPTSVIAPAPEVSRSRMDPAPSLNEAVVAPAPEVNAAVSKRDVRIPQAAVVEPPPSVETASTRKLGDINMGHAQVVAPAPQLPVEEQHTRASAPALGNAAVVPPPPSVQGSVSGKDGRLIALSIHPAAPVAPVETPNGNRRGTFAATPEGKAGAAGTPEIASPNGRTASTGDPRSRGSSNGMPAGLLVGAVPKPAVPSAIGSAPSMASASPPRTGASGRKLAAEMPADAQTDEDRKVFAGRRSYAMSLSLPNLNSSGGSWVMHFSELKDAEKKGDLMAPVATRAVDPGYPLELMRQNVQGTVTLSAIINTDGRVQDVKVLNGVDDRLDAYARASLLRWQFLPALRNGSPVALQAVVMIPFRPLRKGL